MQATPVHEEIKTLAAYMLDTMTHTPDGLQKVHPDLLPVAEFVNGRNRPNAKPPVSVYVTLAGQRWRKQRGGKWQKS